MVPVRPGYKTMNEPTQRLVSLVTAGTLRHPSQAGVVVDGRQPGRVGGRAGNIRPDKSKATERIDGMVALIMALSRVVTQPAVGRRSTRRGDLLVL